jgi:NADPH:quinone reductase-like Zn-dependent oxidoreductase
MSNELYAYALLVLVGFLTNEVWRVIGLVAAGGIDEGSEVFLWARAVATAVLAGVIAKLILFPPGSLASVPPSIRLGAIAASLLAFLLLRRSVFAGVAVGEIVLITGATLAGH